jgi:hypothetical protein
MPTLQHTGLQLRVLTNRDESSCCLASAHGAERTSRFRSPVSLLRLCRRSSAVPRASVRGDRMRIVTTKNDCCQAARIAFVEKVAWVIETVVPVEPATVSTLASSWSESALMMPVPSPVFG